MVAVRTPIKINILYVAVAYLLMILCPASSRSNAGRLPVHAAVVVVETV